MFYDQLAPLGGTLGPLKSDLGLFLPFRATYFMSQKHTSSFLQKGPFPPVDLAENLCVDSNHLPDLNPRVGKWAIPGPKKSFRYGCAGKLVSSQESNCRGQHPSEGRVPHVSGGGFEGDERTFIVAKSLIIVTYMPELHYMFGCASHMPSQVTMWCALCSLL